MFPIGDQDVRGAGIPIVSYAFLAINVLVFLYQATLGQAALRAFIEAWGVIPAEISSGMDLHTLLTSMFMHGGWLHLIGNMLFLWVFADNIEAVIGSPLFAIFYLAGGLAASLAHVFSAPASSIPSLGASGAIAAVLGAYVVMFPQSRVRLLIFGGAGMRVTRTSALIFLGLWAVMQLFNGIASLGVPTAQTSG
ncbi:MAG: rhomboid family intramembrane serine protease, partial [Anaerolineales bacterium]